MSNRHREQDRILELLDNGYRIMEDNPRFSRQSILKLEKKEFISNYNGSWMITPKGQEARVMGTRLYREYNKLLSFDKSRRNSRNIFLAFAFVLVVGLLLILMVTNNEYYS